MLPFFTKPTFAKAVLRHAVQPFALFSVLVVVLIAMSSNLAQAQNKQANNWFFGGTAGVTFNSGAPVALTTSAMTAWEGTASMSDAAGGLLFYTNGLTVWTRTHVPMPNGTGLLGDNSATQSALIVPNPSSTTKYWIFTVAKDGGAPGLDYSEVDMTLNGGNGNVTATKNINLNASVSEKLTAIKKCDGSGYYILAHQWNTGNFLLYETTATVPTPTFVRSQTIGMVHSNSNATNASGYMKASPSGKKVAVAMNQTGFVELYDFNTATGFLSNLKTINTGKWNYGVEFSPNMKYLYVSTWYDNGGNKMIMQYDISVATPNNTYNYNCSRTLGALQIASDGKIYYTNGDYSSAGGQMTGNNFNLGVIASPNNNGGTAGWNDNAVNLSGRTCDHGLPNFTPAYFVDNTKDFTFANLCYGSNTDFTSTLPSDADSVRYFFGDGFESYVRNPSHLYPGAGVYTVKMKIFKGCVADSISKTVTIITCASSACNSGTGCFSPNLITNGDFESGNTAFTSAFTANNGNATCTAGANSCAQYLCGNGYALATSPTPCNPTWSNSIRDHTSGAGNMMLVDFPNSGQNNIWCQTVNLTAATDYCFGAYYINLLPSGTNLPTPTFIYTVGGVPSGNSATIPENEQWNFTGINFNSGAGGSVQLCIKNQNSGGTGYDVAIDDVTLRSTLPGSPPTATQDVIGLCGAATTGSVNVLTNDTPGSGALNNATLRIIQQAPFSQGTATANTATGVISFTASASFSGPVAVQYQICNTSGCCDNGTILIDRLLATVPSVAISQDNAFPNCPDELVMFTATPTNGGTAPTYQWNVGGVDVVGEVNPTFFTNTLTNGQVIKVTMTSNAPCAAPLIATAQVTAVITAIPTPTITGVAALCEGALWDLTAVSPTATLFEWSNGATGNQYQDQPFAPGSTVTVTVTNAAGCTASATKTVVVTPVPLPSISGNILVCQGAGGTVLTATGGTSYHWANGPFTDVYNITNPLTTAVYTVTATTNGCSGTAEETVFVNSVFLTPMASRTQCPNVTINLAASGNSGYEYMWGQEVGGVFSVLVPNTLGANILVTAPIANSIYTVTATDPATGCTATESVTITIGSGAPLTITGNTTVCAGVSTTLSASASTTYAWNTGTPTNAQSITVTPLANTTYTVTITDATGCTNSKTVQVTVNAAPVTVISGITAICNGAPTTLTASGGATYLWNTTATTAAITTPALAVATTYTVTTTAANGCTSSKTQTVTINALPIVSIAAPAAVCSNTTATLTASGGATYIWNTADATASITTAALTTATTYTVTATAASTCTNTASTTLNINALPVTTITGGVAPICAGSNVTLTASTPVVGVTYSWGTAAFTPSPALQTTTTYTVTTTVTATGCTASSEQIVTVTPLPTANITGNQPFCTTSGGITLTASGGTTYLWSNGTTIAATPINPTTPTTYTVTVTENSCTSTASVLVTPNSLTLTAMNPQSICPNTNATIGYTGLPANYTYNWSNGLGTTAQITVTPAATTPYTVTVTDANGCTAQQSVTVTVGASPTPTITGNPASLAICAGSNITLTCATAVSYAWNTPAATQAITVSPITNTTYTVTITAVGGCTATNSVTVIVNALPLATITGTNTICVGANTTLTAALTTPSVASSYAWNNAPVNTTLAVVSIAPSANTTYTVTVTDSNGCTDTESSVVTVNALPIASIAGNAVMWFGTNTTLTASVNTTSNTYIWNTLPSSTTAAITVTPNTTTTYTVTATDASGCTDTESITVTISANPTVSITGPSTVCANGNSTLSAFSASAGATYAWNNGLPNPITVSPLIPTTYTVTATDLNGCTATSSRNISITPTPTPTITPANPSFCMGSGGVTLNATGGTTYTWSSGASGAAATVNPIVVTIYTVTATQGGCTSTATVTVTPNSLVINPLTAQTICAGASATIGNPAIVGLTYNWSSVLATNASGVVTPGSSTTYTVTATDSNGCTDTESVTVTVNALPVVPIIPNVALCAGASTTLTAIGGGTYTWDNAGANPNTVTPAATTTYSVTVTNAATCTATRSVTVTVNPLPVASISGSGVVCINNSVNLVASGAATYMWNGVTAGSNFTDVPLVNTTYTVVATDFNGCTDSETTAITVNSLTIPAITAAQTCANAPVTVGYAVNNPNHSYAWSGGLVPLPATNDISVTILTTTTYTVTVTDLTTNCTATRSVTVTVNNNLQVNIVAPSAVCDGASVTLNATSPSVGATFDWSGTPGASFAVTPLLGGNNVYTVVATGTTGCTGSSTIAITVNPLPTPTITGNAAVCFGKSTPIMGNGGVNYVWDNGLMVQTITVSPVTNPSTYTVTATDVNGCASATSFSISINQLVMPPLTNATVCKGSPALIGYTDNTVTYDWGTLLGTTGQISPTPLVQTDYTVTVTDVNTCTTTSSVTVNLFPDAVAVIPAIAPICRGASATLVANGGVSSVWNVANTTVLPIATTTYTVTITDANGCTDTETTSIVVNQLPTISIADPGSVCINSTITLQASAVPSGAMSYVWDNTTIGASNPVMLFTGGISTYTVTGTDANGCSNSTSRAVTVLVSPAPTVSISANQTSPLCAGSPITFTANVTDGGTSPTYQWFVIDVATSMTTPLGNTYPLVVNTSPLQGALDYYVIVASSDICPAGDGISNNVSFVITPTVTPTISFAASANPICAGDPVTFTATVTNEGAAPIFNWSINNVIQAGATGATFSPVGLNNNDVISVELVSSAACATPAQVTATPPITMIVNPITTPTIAVSTTTPSICQGAVANFTATYTNAGSNPIFQWSVNSVNVGTNTATYSNQTLTSTDVITCTITPSGVCNTGAVTATPISVTVNPNALPSVALDQPAAICEGSPITFTATPTNGGTAPIYAWTVNGGPVTATGATYTNSFLNEGDVVRVSLLSNIACPLSNNVSSNQSIAHVTPAIQPTIRIFTANPTVCAGGDAIFSSFITNGGANPTYQWLINGNIQTTTTPTFTVNTLLTGDVVSCVLVSDAVCALNPTTSTNNIAVNVLPIVIPDVDIVQVPTVCAGATTRFYANPIRGGGAVPIYNWTLNGSAVGTGNPYIANNILPGDVLVVTMAANEQCATGIATSPPYSPNVQILTPSITIQALDTCLLNKGKAYVNVVPTLPVLLYGYGWSNTPSSATDTIFSASSTQIYTVTVSDNLGCSVTASISIPTTGSVTITGLTTTPQLCTTLLSGSATVIHPKTNPPYLHVWTDVNGVGVSTDSVATLAAGTYTVSVTDISGCIATQTTVVQPPLYPEVHITPPFTTLILGDSIRLAATPTAQEAYVYAWSAVPGLACYDCKKPMARPVASSAYTVTITNASGCTATASAEIVIDKQYNVYIPNIMTPNNDGANDNFVIYANSSVNLIKKIKIFDRWGQLVYTNQNLAANNELNTWDGTFRGKDVNNGVFVYIIEVEYVDGTTQTFNGDVTVAR